MIRLACAAALTLLLPFGASALRAAPIPATVPEDAQTPPAQQPDVVPPPSPPPGPPPVQFVAQWTLDRGSTWVVKVDVVDTSTGDVSTETLYLNGGFGLSAGATFLPLVDGRFYTQATIGFEGRQVGASGDTFGWLAFPLEVMEFATVGYFRAGAGLSYLISPRVKGRGAFEGDLLDFEDSAGLIAELDWTFTAEHTPRHTRGWLGLRYEGQSLTDQFHQRWSANAWGFVAGGAF